MPTPSQQPEPTTPEPVPAPTGATTAPTPSSRGFLTTLPWILVALLTGLSVFLGTMYWHTNRELEHLKAGTSTVAPSAQQTTTPAPQPQQPQLTAQPTTGERAEKLMKLAHRKADDPMSIGKVDAPITLIEWADYRCPFCARWALETKPKLMPYVESGSLRIEFRDLPLFGEESQLAHQAARAAGKQGKYWQYYDAVWQLHTGHGHPAFTMKEAEACAQKAGVPDLATFKKDITAPDIVAAVKADATEAHSLGISSTPFFLVNTTPIEGALPTQSFIDVLEQYGAKK